PATPSSPFSAARPGGKRPPSSSSSSRRCSTWPAASWPSRCGVPWSPGVFFFGGGQPTVGSSPPPPPFSNSSLGRLRDGDPPEGSGVPRCLRAGAPTWSRDPPRALYPPPGLCRKYPAIRSGRQREGYRAVFCDQHAEYRELLGEVREARRRLGELEAAAHHALSRTVGVPSVSHQCPISVPWVSPRCPISVPWVSCGCRAQLWGRASRAGDIGLPLLTPQGDSGVARVWHEVLRKKRVSRARGSCTRS
uniref:OCEL domain-containing protein n=1 Tax=Anas platyrhynchos platyrhynchos TaxID=8840 RepID=A0A493THE1_ANAPP